MRGGALRPVLPSLGIQHILGDFMLRSLGLMTFLLLFTGYWVYHLMNGPRSIFARAEILEDQAFLAAELQRVENENSALRAQIAGLKPETLDTDLLIERLHALSLTLPGEILLYTSQSTN